MKPWNRWYTVALVLLAIVLTAYITTIARTAPETVRSTVVRATRFELVDKDGKLWGWWSAKDPNYVLMVINNRPGNEAETSSVSMLVHKKTNKAELAIKSFPKWVFVGDISLWVPSSPGIAVVEDEGKPIMLLPYNLEKVYARLKKQDKLNSAFLKGFEHFAALETELHEGAQGDETASTSEDEKALSEALREKLRREDELDSLRDQYLKNYLEAALERQESKKKE